MDRKKDVSAGMQLALYQAGPPARRLLKKHIRKKVKQSVSGLIRKPELQTSVRFADRMNLANKVYRKKGKQVKNQKKLIKILARLLKYALREKRYS